MTNPVLLCGESVPSGLLVALKAHRAVLHILLTYGALDTASMRLHEDYWWRDVEETAGSLEDSP
jgi:hypothetical protein